MGQPGAPERQSKAGSRVKVVTLLPRSYVIAFILLIGFVILTLAVSRRREQKQPTVRLLELVDSTSDNNDPAPEVT